MTYRLTEEERALRQTVRGFAERELAPLVADAEETGTFPRDTVLPSMAKLGLMSIGVPEAMGGVGGSSLMLCLVAEEMARVCGGFAIGSMPSVLAPAALAAMQAPKQPDPMLLQALMQGAIMPALAFTEPGGGSDLAALGTVATPVPEGVRLDGSKAFISNAPIADVFLIAAIHADFAGASREERLRGFGVHVVPRGTPGLTIGKPLRKLGMRSSPTSELHLEGVLVPHGAPRIGGKQGRFGQMMRLIDFNRLYIAALSLGIAQAAFEHSLRYVQERCAFGRPIAEHQATGFKVARMSVELDASRALLQRACEAYDSGERSVLLISEAKLFATEAAVRITTDAVQIHGGYGYVQDFPVERFFRDARVGTIWEGTSEIQQRVICRELGMLGTTQS